MNANTSPLLFSKVYDHNSGFHIFDVPDVATVYCIKIAEFYYTHWFHSGNCSNKTGKSCNDVGSFSTSLEMKIEDQRTKSFRQGPSVIRLIPSKYQSNKLRPLVIYQFIKLHAYICTLVIWLQLKFV